MMFSRTACLSFTLALSCQSADGHHSHSAPRSTPAKTAGSTPKEENTPLLPMPPGEEVSFSEELAQVSRFRQLKSQGTIHGLQVKVADLIAHVEGAVDLGTPERALLGTEEMLVALGVVPLDFQYRATMLRLLRGELAGLYEPRLKTMLIRADLQGVERQMTLLHELVHALQDQHFDLEEVVQWTPDDGDRSTALSCLAEGDATSAMFDGILPQGQTALSLPVGFIQEKIRAAGEAKKADNSVPPLISRSLRAPYLDGLTFVHQLRRRGGWAEVDRVWRNPPTTTEQVLHIEKYDAGEIGVPVAVPSAPTGAGEWKLLLHDIWGEQSLRLVFQEWMKPSLVEKSAAGWGGDRIALYQKDGKSAFAWHIVADSVQDGQELFEAFSAGLNRIASKTPSEKKSSAQFVEQGASPSTSTDEGSKTLCGPAFQDKPSIHLALEWKGKDVWLVSSPFSRKAMQMGSCAEALSWLQAWVTPPQAP